nr:PREDICTED: fatty-acid amide hydrolase 2 isoform X2 [Megachile rotundata]XP_012151004.1 PREDICTED: fatty-acid amide hydrolase 2 isoform X2 [Megachile rotundata]XP_012151005.1 PREDICTED: fatty-acid amide hydrolase 2 isoform X2 [Megachile rotundata]
MSSTTVARKIRNGQLSSQRVVEAFIERTKEVNPFLNAVIEDRFEEALKDARTCDEMLRSGKVIASNLENEKPLYGVPITIKESCRVEGMSITGGSIVRKDFKSEEDGDAVRLLRNAGAIILLVSNTPELCSATNSFNFLFGQTYNPYDLRRSSGGSSGGEGALVAAGASMFGLGSDFVGSIRIPALYNGIFGHKPSPGLVPNKGHYPSVDNQLFDEYLVLGPLTKYAEDLQLTMKILSAECKRPLNWNRTIDLKDLRVFYMDNIDYTFGLMSTSSDIRQSVHKVVEFLASNGAQVQKISQDWVKHVSEMELSSFADLDVSELVKDPKHPDRTTNPYIEFIKSIFGLARNTRSVNFVRIITTRHGFLSRSKLSAYKQMKVDIRQEIKNVLSDNGVFIYPTLPQPALFPESVLSRFDHSAYTAIANMFLLPSTHVPMGLNRNGLPIGLQVSAGPYQDPLCIAVAKILEKEFGGWVPPS